MADEAVGYKKTYRLRRVIPGRDHITVVVPFIVVQRQADLHKLTVSEYLTQFGVEAEFNGFEGIRYIFKELPKAGAKC